PRCPWTRSFARSRRSGARDRRSAERAHQCAGLPGHRTDRRRPRTLRPPVRRPRARPRALSRGGAAERGDAVRARLRRPRSVRETEATQEGRDADRPRPPRGGCRAAALRSRPAGLTVRFAGPTLLAAVVSAGAAAAVALFSASRLAEAPVRGRLAGPDPLGSLASAAALALGLVVFYRLGRSIGAHQATARVAIVCGAIGGALAGLASGTAQAVALADYLGAVLVTYAVPPTFLAVAL